jgi:pimeloyl-ACP methyl ester carboxylesterase
VVGLAGDSKTTVRSVRIPADGAELAGDLVVPAGALALVIFAHGSGSSRFSPRNRFVAGVLNQAGLATLLFDLLTAAEEDLDRYSGRYRFDIPLLATRLEAATVWAKTVPELAGLRVGYFGASTGAAAALIAAANRPAEVGAIVSRGGRPDLAADYLDRVQAPTLLIVGGNDWPVLDLNRRALEKLRCEARLEVVPGAGHLFEEPGALERVAELARDWFKLHLAGAEPARGAKA